jgi:hypothetical protein
VATAIAAWGAWQGKARAKATGSGTARDHGAGARARARVLVFQSRGVAVPCAGHQHPGPAARRGGEGRRRLWGHGGGAAGPCTRTPPRPEREGALGIATEGSSAARGSRWQQGEEKGTAEVMLTGGAEGGKCSVRRRDGAVARRSRAVQRGVVGVVDQSAGLVRMLRWWRQWRRPPRSAPGPPPLPSLPLVWRRRKGKPGASRV